MFCLIVENNFEKIFAMFLLYHLFVITKKLVAKVWREVEASGPYP